MKPSRREFLALGSAALIGMSVKAGRPIAGSFVNDNFGPGHRLRDRAAFPAADRVEKFPIVIVGGGMAGLNAAWRLHKRGFDDFVVLEMNPQAGGNSRWGENEITAYPWAAHYVPVPGPNATYVRELFEDLGALRNGKWEERFLCFAPQERLYLFGRWQDGIEPSVGLGKDRDQFSRLEEMIAKFRASGRFTIPMERGFSTASADLDRLSFSAWLRGNGFDSRILHWYMDYCCRDDYGAVAAETSAWAGIHYFASRQPEDPGPLTWPEGNGWITRRLLERIGRFVRPEQMVHRIAKRGRGCSVFAGPTEYRAEVVIFAAPTFLAGYLVEGMAPPHPIEYSPWLTANLTLDRLPRSSGGSLPAWDNVVMDSATLGYVDATHQSVRTHLDRTVWTFYWALAQGSAAQNRQLLLQRDWSYWRDAILSDLERVHPDIRDCVSRIDVMRFGHAMARPTPGTIFSPDRLRLTRDNGPLLFANSDLSGFSIFEEAQYRGVTAADRALARIGGAGRQVKG